MFVPVPMLVVRTPEKGASNGSLGDTTRTLQNLMSYGLTADLADGRSQRSTTRRWNTSVSPFVSLLTRFVAPDWKAT